MRAAPDRSASRREAPERARSSRREAPERARSGRRRALVGLLTAETLSLVGTRMSLVALPWFALSTTGSAARTGVVAFAEMLPYVLACGLGGPLIDRVGGRRTSVVADVASTLAVAAVPVLHLAGGLTFGALCALVAAAGLLRGFGDTAKRVVFPVAVEASGTAMTRATSLHDGLSRLATLLGASLAGLLVAALDAPVVLLVDAATFAVAALVVAVAVRPRPPVRPDSAPPGEAAPGQAAPGQAAPEDAAPPGRHEPYLVALAAGLRFLLRDRLIRGVALMLFVTNLADAAYGTVLAPVWARDIVGSPVALGLLSAVFATGAMLGNVVFTAIAPRVPRFPVFAVGFLIAGAPRFVVLGVLDREWIVYPVAFAAGLAIAAVNPILGAVSYERIPESLRARVLGLSQALCWAGIPLGGLLAGWAVSGLDLRVACLLFGLAYLVVTVRPFLGRTWRELDRDAGPDADGAADGGPVPVPGGAVRAAGPGSADDRDVDPEQHQGHRGDREEDQQVTTAVGGVAGDAGRDRG